MIFATTIGDGIAVGSIAFAIAIGYVVYRLTGGRWDRRP